MCSLSEWLPGSLLELTSERVCYLTKLIYYACFPMLYNWFFGHEYECFVNLDFLMIINFSK